MKKSQALVHGRFWAIFAHLAVLAIVITLAIFVLALIPTIILPMVGLDSLIPFINTLTSSVSGVAILVSFTVLYLSAKTTKVSPGEQAGETAQPIS